MPAGRRSTRIAEHFLNCTIRTQARVSKTRAAAIGASFEVIVSARPPSTYGVDAATFIWRCHAVTKDHTPANIVISVATRYDAIEGTATGRPLPRHTRLASAPFCLGLHSRPGIALGYVRS